MHAGAAPAARSARARAGRLGAGLAAPCGVAALLVWLGFNAGGFFPGTVGFGAIAAGIALLVWLTTAGRPFEGASLPLLVAVGALTLFAIWILLSAGWSHSPARAIVEFDRSLLYVLLLLTAGLAAGRLGGPRRILWGLAAGAFVICGAGLITRVAPDLWPIRQTLQADRLSYPVTYWNTLGLLGAMGWVACLHLTCSLREARVVRILAAAATPVLAATVYFTFSRGAILMMPLGVVAYLALARPRGAAGALLSVVPPTALAVIVAFGADALASDDPTTRAAVDQGRTVGIVVLAAMVLAAVLRPALAPLDRRMERAELRLPSRGRLLAAGAALLAVVVVAGVAAGAPDRVRTQWQNFTQEGDVDPAGGSRDRLAEVGNNGRLDHWRVALKGFDASPLHGAGAGTYPNLWSKNRPQPFDVQDAHSLYLETLGELGVVGLGLVLVLVLVLLGGALRRVRGPDRAVAAAVFAVGLMWAVRAGLDWDWEMPVVTVWVLLAGGALLARPAAAAQERGGLVPGRTGRLLLGIGVLVLLVTPALVAQSQGRLQESIRAFKAGDCAKAVDDALASNSALSVRPEPFLVLGFCDVRIGRPRLGIDAIEGAIKRDPDNWQYRYSLALVKAASGIDPRPDARRAARMNPLSQLTRDALQRFDSDDPAVWKRRSVTAPLPS
jgi:O-antigen ligase